MIVVGFCHWALQALFKELVAISFRICFSPGDATAIGRASHRLPYGIMRPSLDHSSMRWPSLFSP